MSTATARVIPLAQPDAAAPLGEWAAFYATLALRVLPLQPRAKVPATLHGVKDATTDVRRIESWWRECPDYNIGVACGAGLVVLDVDHRHGGAETFDRIMAEHRFPAAPFVVTGDGLHVWLRDPSERWGTLTKLGDGVEARGAGYYVVAPPSIHPSGRRYTWAKGHGPVETRGLPTIPETIPETLLGPAPTQAKPTPKPPPRVSSGGLPTAYGRKALDGLLQDIATATEGDRHPTIYRAAARAGDLIRLGHLEGGAAFDALVDAGLAVAGDKYKRAEVERVVGKAILEPSHGGVGGVA